MRALLVDLPNLLLRLLRLNLAPWGSLFRRRSEFDQRQRHSFPDCVPMSHGAFKVPDPLIYSQSYLLGLGLAVTWDNPDIVLRKDNVDVSSHALEADTEYEIVARIWNNSLDAPVVDLPVKFSYLGFGIGTQSVPITAPGKPVFVNLGVKGGPDHPAYAVVKWRTPPTPGHYCIQVKLDPVSDANVGNNLGQENTQVGAAKSPAEFTFLLRNNTLRQAVVRLETDTYVLPDRPTCGPSGRATFDPRAHFVQRHPVPPGWFVDINPSSPVLEPDQELTVAVTITPPQGFVGVKNFNINAFTPWNCLGGVTLRVKAE
jgi:hypothetical protein